MILKRGEVVSSILKRQKDELNRTYLNFRDIIFIIIPVSDRAYWVQIFFPYVWVDWANVYEEDEEWNVCWLAYDRDFEEWYESIESAEWAVETWLSNVLHFYFTNDEKDGLYGKV